MLTEYVVQCQQYISKSPSNCLFSRGCTKLTLGTDKLTGGLAFSVAFLDNPPAVTASYGPMEDAVAAVVLFFLFSFP